MIILGLQPTSRPRHCVRYSWGIASSLSSFNIVLLLTGIPNKVDMLLLLLLLRIIDNGDIY